MRLFFLLCSVFSVLLLHGETTADNKEGTSGISPERSVKIIEKITEKYSKMYRKYAGVKNTRHAVQVWKEVDSGDVLSREEIVYTRWDYFYRDLVYKTHSYRVDGKKEDPDDFSSHEDEPGIPIFDRKGQTEYHRRVEWIETIKGRECYRILVDPKDPETNHFKGHVWVTVDGLELILTKGASGKKRFGCKDLSVTMWSCDFGDVSHFTSGEIRVNISVLGLYRRILEISFQNRDIHPIPRKKR